MLEGTILYVVLLVSLVVHEAAHALTALWGGDKTAYLGGQVTLNPVPHIQREPFGTVLLPIGLLMMSGGTMTMGYAHAPVDPVWAHYNPRKAAFMSAAGPLSNFLLVGLWVLILKVLVASGLMTIQSSPSLMRIFVPADGASDGPVMALGMIGAVFVFLNILLGVLNLIPLPPLDGAGVVSGLFPKSIGRVYENLRAQPMFALGGMILVFYLFYGYGFRYLVIPAFNVAVEFVRG